MKIVQLGDEHLELFSQCLEDWSADIREAGTRRRAWIERTRPLGLRAQLAIDDDGQVAGMLQHLPVERSNVDGEGLRFVPCVWVHGHPQGRGDRRGRGLGSALLEAAEADARAQGATGLAAWGVWLPFWMRASWFRRHGYRKVDRQGLAVLLWKPFAPDARPPRWFPADRKRPPLVPGKVTVTAFTAGWCSAGNLVTERARRAALELGERVVFQEIDTSERAAVAEWGQTDALFIDGRQARYGPPPSYEKIRRRIERRLRALGG